MATPTPRQRPECSFTRAVVVWSVRNTRNKEHEEQGTRGTEVRVHLHSGFCFFWRPILGGLWRQQQMHVVDHQHPRMQVAVLSQAQLTQLLQVALVVARVEEAGLAVIATLHDVLCNAGQVDTGLTWHGDIHTVDRPTVGPLPGVNHQLT